MGDRFEMTLKCTYCNMPNKVYYAPTCGIYDFRCNSLDFESKEFPKNKGCGKINFICSDFTVKKAEEVTEQNVIDAFEMATSMNHKPSAIKREAKQYIKNLKKELKQETKQ